MLHVGASKRIRTAENVIDSDFSTNWSIYILPTGITKSRIKIFNDQIVKLGGVVFDKFSDQVTHLVVDDKIAFSKIKKIIGLSFASSLKIVKSTWLSTSIKKGVFVNTERFTVEFSDNSFDSSLSEDAKPSNTSDNSPIENSSSKTLENTSHSLTVPSQKSFVCSISSADQSLNHNKHITDRLEVLAKLYKSTKDYWREVGYQKAIIALKQYPKEVTCWEEAKAIPGIGEKIADKIYEIVQSGNLRKIDETCFEEKVKALDLFSKIWGIGPNIAESFVQQGFRTLEDLKAKGKLTKSQQIGIKYFDEFQDRMPRSEAAEIFSQVCHQVNLIDSQLQCTICGSYRRGRETCGDIDVLVTHSDGISHKNVLIKITSALHDSGLLTDDLVCQQENGAQKKIYGCL